MISVFEGLGLALCPAVNFSIGKQVVFKKKRLLDCKKVFVGLHPAENRLCIST